VISELVLARVGNQCGESGDERQGIEDDVRCPVSPCVAQLVDDRAVVRERQAFARERGTRDVATQVLEALAVVGVDADLRVQREASFRGAQWPAPRAARDRVRRAASSAVPVGGPSPPLRLCFGTSSRLSN